MELFRQLGWEHLDDGTGDHFGIPTDGPFTHTRVIGPIKPWKGGTPMQISFHPSKKSTQKGLSHRFRIGKSATKADVLTLALATQGDWYWMTDLTGHRISRDEWLAWGMGLALYKSA